MVYMVFSDNCNDPDTHNGSADVFPTPEPFTPSVSDSVKISLTAFYISMYSVLFIIVYLQLWLILYYNYKRFSFQTVFLFLCAAWSGLRTTLFTFYIYNTKEANTLQLFWYWLLYCFPVCLQFFTLSLLNLYFSQVMFKAKSQYAANPKKYKTPLRISCVIMDLIFLGMNVSCAVIVHSETSPNVVNPDRDIVSAFVTARVVVNDVLFVVCGIWLAYCIVRISKTTSANILLEAKGTTVCQASTVGFLIVLLYTSRAIYNLLAISPLRCSQMTTFNFDWYNVSDQADLVDVKELTYVVFGVVLFVWELLPTGLVIFFFRVRKQEQSMASELGVNSQSYGPRVYFFDNPHRYDSDEETTPAHTASNSTDHLQPSLQRSNMQNSTTRSYSSHGLLTSPSSPRRPSSYYRDPYRFNQQGKGIYPSVE